MLGLPPSFLKSRCSSCEVFDDSIELVWGALLLLASIAADDGNLDIVATNGVLHHVFESLKDHLLSLVQAHRRVVLFLDRLHGSLLAGANRIRLPLSVSA